MTRNSPQVTRSSFTFLRPCTASRAFVATGMDQLTGWRWRHDPLVFSQCCIHRLHVHRLSKGEEMVAHFGKAELDRRAVFGKETVSVDAPTAGY
jgi:hypothetical protein